MMKNFTLLLFTLTSSFFIYGQSIVMDAASDNQVFFGCGPGGLFDSGGTGASAPYQNNENYTVTICPDDTTTGEFISLYWTVFNLDPTNTAPNPNNNADYIAVYDGPNTSATHMGNYTGTSLANLVVSATNLNTSGCLTIVFVSNDVGTGDFNAQYSCETPCDNPNAAAEIVNGFTSDSIRVCVGDPVTFQDIGSTAMPGFTLDGTYRWTFGSDGIDSTSGATATHSFANPGEYLVQLTVTDDNGCENLNLTDLQVLVSTYPTFDPFPTDTTLCLGESVVLIAEPGQYDSTWTGFPTGYVGDDCDEFGMGDNVGVLNSLTIPMSGFDPAEIIDDINDIVNISVDIEHSFMGDFVLQIQCPTGQIVTLHQQGGGGTYLGVPVDNTLDCNDPSTLGIPWTYTFDNTATETWVDWVNAQAGWGLTLPAGAYQPVDPLSGLIGCPLNGTWTLLFTDLWGGDDGSIPSWNINFDPSLYPDITQFTSYVGDGQDSSYWDLADPWITANTADLNEITVEPGAAGTFVYTYTVTNDFGCSFDSSITVTVNDNPFADAGTDTSLCGGGAASVQLQGGIGAGGASANCDYVLSLVDSWPDGWNGNTIDVTVNGVTTNYTCTWDQDDFVIPVSHGDVITLQWNATGSWQSENEIYLYDGAGNLVYSDGTNGATPSTNSVDITADCFGGMVFEWTPAATLDDPNIPNPNATPTGVTDYVLTVYPTGHPLCFTTDTVTVSLGGASDPGTDGTAFFCADGTPEDLYNYLGGTPQNTGVWIDPTSGDTIAMPFDPAILPAGDYEYHVDSLGCTSFSTVTVEIDAPTSSNTAVDSDCGACNGEVTLAGANGQGFYEYSIDNGATYQSSDTYTGLCPGDHFFVVRDSLGCTINDTATVNEINFPTISFDDTTSTDCGGATGSISVNSNSGSTPFQFGLVGGAMQADSTITGLGTGSYDVVLVDNFGCTDTLFGVVIDSINIPSIANVTAVDVDCNSANNGSVTIDGQYITNYSVNGGAFQANGTFNGLAPGNYTVLVENDFGCQDTSSFSITEPAPLQLQITSLPIDSICMGESSTLTVTGSGGNGGPYTFDWYEGATSIGQGASIDVTPSASMLNYCAVISEACGSPTDTACTSVYIEPFVMPAFTVNQVDGCYPIDVTFTNTTQGTVATSNWFFGDGSDQSVAGTSSVINTYDYDGLFSVTLEVVTPEGCVYDTTYADLIETYGYPNANFTFNPNPVSMFDPTVTFQDLSSGNIVSWLWGFPGATPSSSSVQDPIVTYPEGQPGIYNAVLTVVNDHGCVDSASAQVRVVNEVILYAPNAFTPDGDSYNDTWRVFIDGIDFQDFELIIFNRWGEKVFESYNAEVGWDGRFMGNIVQDGTYVWIIRCKDQWTDRKYTFNGHITVIR